MYNWYHWTITITVILLIYPGTSLRLFHNGRPRGRWGMVGIPNHEGSTDSAPEQWFEQSLDHFNPTDRRTWKQRYFVNDTFYKPGGPAFLMIGGEGEANAIWMSEGQWINYAQEFNAICFQLEHRYYGKSHPTSDLSVKNLEYLSSEQALADLASFSVGMTTKYNLTGSRWIAFGGSYPGSLAAWYRLKYPHLVYGSVSASAPVYAKIDFAKYLGVVNEALQTVNEECTSQIRLASSQLDILMKHRVGWKTIEKKFQLCEELDATNTNDVSNLLESLAGNFEGVVQYNRDNRQFEGAKGANITIDTLCSIMTNNSSGTAVHRYALVNSMILNAYGEKCLDFKYKKMIKEMQQSDWNSSIAEGGKQWTYQTCTEFGFFQSSELKEQPFGNEFPVDFFIQQCSDIFGPRYNKALLERGVKRTNMMYGGFGLKVKRVVFINGSIDPWHALGITWPLSNETETIYIKGTAHCANMYPPAASDLPQLVEARQKIGVIIGQWLKES